MQFIILAPRSAKGVQFGNPETIRENQAIRANLRIDSRKSGHLRLSIVDIEHTPCKWVTMTIIPWQFTSSQCIIPATLLCEYCAFKFRLRQTCLLCAFGGALSNIYIYIYIYTYIARAFSFTELQDCTKLIHFEQFARICLPINVSSWDMFVSNCLCWIDLRPFCSWNFPKLFKHNTFRSICPSMLSLKQSCITAFHASFPKVWDCLIYGSIGTLACPKIALLLSSLAYSGFLFVNPDFFDLKQVCPKFSALCVQQSLTWARGPPMITDAKKRKIWNQTPKYTRLCVSLLWKIVW